MQGRLRAPLTGSPVLRVDHLTPGLSLSEAVPRQHPEQEKFAVQDLRTTLEVRLRYRSNNILKKCSWPSLRGGAMASEVGMTGRQSLYLKSCGSNTYQPHSIRGHRVGHRLCVFRKWIAGGWVKWINERLGEDRELIWIQFNFFKVNCGVTSVNYDSKSSRTHGTSLFRPSSVQYLDLVKRMLCCLVMGFCHFFTMCIFYF